MSDQKLSPCPECGGECKILRESTVFSQVACYGGGCMYSLDADTKEQAIANHERLAGRCRWERGSDRAGGSVWTTECSNMTVSDLRPFRYCPDCGKQIEEVGGEK